VTYIAVLRSWNGWSRDNIEVQENLKKKFGQAEDIITVCDLNDALTGHRHAQVF
jgi:hypothetical protein